MKYYNEEYKLKYLEENSDVNLTLSLHLDRFFRKIMPFEESLDKDLYNFNTQDIVDFYKYLGTPSFESLQVMNNQFKIYTQKSMEKNLVRDNQNHYAELTPELLLTCVNKGLAERSIYTRKQIEQIVDSLDNACDGFYILGLFEGIRGIQNEDLIELYADNFYKDENGCRVKLKSGKDIPITAKLYDLAFESINCYDYWTGSLTVYGGIGVKHLRQDDARVIKTKIYKVEEDLGTDTLHNRCVSLQKKYRKIKKLTDLNFTQNMVAESGRIDFIKQLMAKNELSLEKCISVCRPEIEYRYGKIQCLSTYILKYGQYFDER